MQPLGWKTVIITNKDGIQRILENPNGNKGFGNEIDKLLILTSDMRYFNWDREVFQPFIDGGMYAMSVINNMALWYRAYSAKCFPDHVTGTKCSENYRHG